LAFAKIAREAATGVATFVAVLAKLMRSTEFSLVDRSEFH
jgi:hypothetical protein